MLLLLLLLLLLLDEGHYWHPPTAAGRTPPPKVKVGVDAHAELLSAFAQLFHRAIMGKKQAAVKPKLVRQSTDLLEGDSPRRILKLSPDSDSPKQRSQQRTTALAKSAEMKKEVQKAAQAACAVYAADNEREQAPMPKKTKAERQLYEQAYRLCRHTNVQGIFDCTTKASFFFCSDVGKIIKGTIEHKRCGKHRLLGQRNAAYIVAHHKRLNARLDAPKKEKRSRSPRVKTATQVLAKKEQKKKGTQCQHFFPNGDQCKKVAYWVKRNADGSSVSKHEYSKRRCSEHHLAGQETYLRLRKSDRRSVSKKNQLDSS